MPPPAERNELEEYRTDYRRVTGVVIGLLFGILLGLIAWIWQNHEGRITHIENDYQAHKEAQAQQLGGARLERIESKVDMVTEAVNALRSEMAAQKATAEASKGRDKR